MSLTRLSVLGRIACVAGLFMAAGLPAQAQQGTITGTVTDRATGQPVERVQVNVVGTVLGAATNAQGVYTIRNVPVGNQQVRALRVGYGEQKRSVTVGSAISSSVDIAMSAIAVSLTEVVTTATGPSRRVELGNAVSTIDAAEATASSTIRSINDLLNSRAPGVVVQTGVQTGTGSRVRIRGQSSLNLNNDPIYIIDGIRMTSDNGSSRYGSGGAGPSRVGDINPEDIEDIEIVKGPSAATLYGTAAANGVILITTKRGRAGAPRWTVYGESGVLTDRNNYPFNYTIAGRSPGSTTARTCTLPQVSAGTCLQDSLRVYAPIHDPDATPIGTGNRYQTGVQLSAGSESINYFLSAEREQETGTFELPAFERRRFDSTGTFLRDYTERPNALAKNSVRANITAKVGSKLDMSVQSAFINSDSRLSLESNATAGIGSHLFGGPGFKDNCQVAVSPGTPCNGYRAWTPGYSWQEKTSQRINRFIIGADANWRPFSWNQTRITVGNDLTDRVDDRLRFRGEGPPLTAIYREGFAGQGRTDIRTSSVNLSSAASFTPRPWFVAKTTVGGSYSNYQFEQAAGEGQNLPPGTRTPGAGAVPNAASGTTLSKTLGAFIEEAVALNDRLFLTAAVRSDQNSAFGTDFQSVIYPKASISWILSDEAFFPGWSWLDQFRVRSAYGSSGVQPGTNDAIRSFEASTPNIGGTDVPGVINDRIGNANLRPEKSTEFEAGFETRMLSSRVSVDFTFYRKRTKDALINAVIAPSAGTGVTQVRQNLGQIQNKGFELLTNIKLLDRNAFAWDLAISGSTNSNRLISLGETPPQINVSTRVVEDYPLFGWWARPITGWEDKNGDKILTYNADPALNEVFVGDSAIFRGYTQPRHIVTLTNGFDLLSRKLRLQTLLDYRGGYKAYNNTERIRCVSRQNCNGLVNPESSFEEQAMVVATRDHPSRTLDGFYQKGDFVKLREVSLRLALPTRFAGMIRARNADFTLAGRNLGTWTKYRGVDPENDYQATDGGDVPSDFQTVGPASYFVARLSLGF